MPRKPSKATIADAVRTLDGLAAIARNEQVIRGVYISQDIDEKLADQGAICQGHRACLIGSTWLAWGVKPTTAFDYYTQDTIWNLPNTSGGRDEFVDDKPGLDLALRALDEAARRYVAKTPWRHFQPGFRETFEGYTDSISDEYQGYGHPAECLFEEGFVEEDAELQRKVRSLALAAKRLLTQDKVR